MTLAVLIWVYSIQCKHKAFSDEEISVILHRVFLLQKVIKTVNKPLSNSTDFQLFFIETCLKTLSMNKKQ